MSKSLAMVRNVRRIVKDLVGVKEGEKVLIYTDTGQKTRIVELYANEVTALGAEPFIFTMLPRRIQGGTVPDPLAVIFKQVDVVFELTTVFCKHHPSRWESQKKGVRWGGPPEMTEEILIGPSGLDLDFFAFEPMMEKLREEYQKAKIIRYRTAAGTDLTASKEGREARALTGIALKPGTHMGAQDLEISTAPVEGTANGKVVVDTWIVDLGVLGQPVTITIKDGIATDIEGGEEARLLKEMLLSVGDPMAFAVCEMAFGCNPLCRLDLVDVRRGVTEAEGIYGTAHIALGHSPWPGSSLRAPCHIDCVYRQATVEFDGKIIMQDGELIDEFKQLVPEWPEGP
ncbi:MAG: aminopeptidase, partial [Desulfobacterales bacterium]